MLLGNKGELYLVPYASGDLSEGSRTGKEIPPPETTGSVEEDLWNDQERNGGQPFRNITKGSRFFKEGGDVPVLVYRALQSTAPTVLTDDPDKVVIDP